MPEISVKNQNNTNKKNRLGRGLNSLLDSSIIHSELSSIENDLSIEKSIEILAKDNIKNSKSNKSENKPDKLYNKQNSNNNYNDSTKMIEDFVHMESKISDEARIWKIPIEKISTNPNQPRQHFDEDKIKELASSIKEKGILQPIVVRRISNGSLELIAGERRWRAAQKAGIHEIPVIIKNVNVQDSFELALIENIQRQDLNPIEEAEAYQKLIERYSLTQNDIAKKVGKDRASVANTLRLLSLDPEVRKMVSGGFITFGHAKALLTIDNVSEQIRLAKKIISDHLSVRLTEKFANATKKISKQKMESTTEENEFNASNELKNISKRLIKDVKENLQKNLGTKVAIDYEDGKGIISIHYYTKEQFNQIVENLQATVDEKCKKMGAGKNI